MAAGLYTFGGNVNGLLLSNYAGTDLAAAVGKLGILISVLFGFPLNFLMLRVEVAAVASRRKALDRNQLRMLSTALLVATAAPALVLKDVGVAQAILGALFGPYLAPRAGLKRSKEVNAWRLKVFIAPALMSRSLRRQKGQLKKPLRSLGLQEWCSGGGLCLKCCSRGAGAHETAGFDLQKA